MKLGLVVTAVAFAVLSSGAFAHADTITTYSLSNVGLTYGVGGAADGSLSGTFTYDFTTKSLVSADITATAAGSTEPIQGGGYTFTYGTLSPAPDSTYAGAGFTSYFQLTSIASPNDVLQLDFGSALNGSGADAIASGTYENETTLGVRNVGAGFSATIGSAAAAPEPSSIALLGTGLLGLGGLLRRRLA